MSTLRFVVVGAVMEEEAAAAAVICDGSSFSPGSATNLLRMESILARGGKTLLDENAPGDGM